MRSGRANARSGQRFAEAAGPVSHHGWCETSRTVRVPFRRRTTRLCEARGRPS
ncbi:hypothetical protein HMPREF0043_00305 [Actinobaculum sp. oral taxon 183 str. F0552]|nr:hypothetical protein HMPREF0043_00305 [Actinobaculum sp. oral taxon 183 str. F0552]